MPVSADLEDCFADDAGGRRRHDRGGAIDAGAAGASVEDFARADGGSIYDLGLATERVAAAVEAAAGSGFVLTARAENLIRGVDDLDDTIRRLQAYQEAGADVLFAPGLLTSTEVRTVVGQLDVRSTCILLPGGPTVAELAEAGVARISVGGALAGWRWAAVADAARELLTAGTHSYDAGRRGRRAAAAARGGCAETCRRSAS